MEKIMKKQNARFLALGGLIAALYIVLTLLMTVFGLSSGLIQVRISEALCILPVFTPAAIPGLFIGCLFANLLTGAAVWDIVFGSLATLAAALLTRALRKNRWLACLPPIIINTIAIPFILYFAYHLSEGIGILFLTVGAGEIISAGILGQLLYSAVNKHRSVFQRR